MEMLIATPVSPWELTLGKVLPFVAIGLVFSSVIEPRIFTPLIPLLSAGALFTLFDPEDRRAASAGA